MGYVRSMQQFMGLPSRFVINELGHTKKVQCDRRKKNQQLREKTRILQKVYENVHYAKIVHGLPNLEVGKINQSFTSILSRKTHIPRAAVDGSALDPGGKEGACTLYTAQD